MGWSRRSGRRGGIGALAMLAFASGLVAGTATVAEAKQIKVNSVKTLKSACAKAGGTFSQVQSAAICDVSGGKTVYCNDKKKGKKCAVVDTIYRGVVSQDSVRIPNGDDLTTQTVSDSHVWKQKMTASTLSDVVCPSLGGDFVASADATIGACGTPTATIICTDRPGADCLGIADTEKHAQSIPKQVKTQVGNTGSAPTTAATTPTTSPNAPPTTKKKCVGRRCPPPTLPPGKAPTQSVPVSPPQNR